MHPLVSNLTYQLSFQLSHSHLLWFTKSRHPWVHRVRQKINQKYKAINKVKDVVCFLLSCRKYFCKYVESIKYLLDSAFFDDSDKTIMYRGNLCWQKMWLCNLCTFATRPIKVLFSYFKKYSPIVSDCLWWSPRWHFSFRDTLLLWNVNEA